MELNITRFVTSEEMADFSASQMELGERAGQITWANAKREAAACPLLTTSEQIDEAKIYFEGFGAWNADEIAAWSDTDVNAMVVQEIACRMREIESLCMDDNGDIDWQKVERLSEQGTILGIIYQGDNEQIYIYLGD